MTTKTTKTTKARKTATATKGAQIKCPKCPKSFVEGYISKHLRIAHGVVGGRRGLAKANGAALHEVSPNGNGHAKGAFQEMPDFKVLRDGKGAIWVAERTR